MSSLKPIFHPLSNPLRKDKPVEIQHINIEEQLAIQNSILQTIHPHSTPTITRKLTSSKKKQKFFTSPKSSSSTQKSSSQPSSPNHSHTSKPRCRICLSSKQNEKRGILVTPCHCKVSKERKQKF